jgi:tripartite-type tricarboxylate transporter receptor subunit TctC
MTMEPAERIPYHLAQQQVRPPGGPVISGRKMRRSWLLSLAMMLICSVGASAQSWPDRPIKGIVPYTAGGAIDIVSRTVAQQLSVELGQSIFIETRPGAGGTIGTNAVAKADPDGYTILLTASSHTVAPWVYANLPYDTVRDFSAVTPLATLPNVLVVSADKNIKTARQLVDSSLVKASRTNYASAGAGSATHLNAERFLLSAGLRAVHIPFKGGPEALREVIAGRVDFYFSPLLIALPFIQSGQLRALAVSNARRVAALPDVPTTAEAGFPNSDYNFWVAMFVPSRTPRDIVDKLYGQTAKVQQLPETKAKLATLGAEPMMMKPAEFDAYVKNEIATNEALVKAAGLAAQ